jgi:hypothetical protein
VTIIRLPSGCLRGILVPAGTTLAKRWEKMPAVAGSESIRTGAAPLAPALNIMSAAMLDFKGWLNTIVGLLLVPFYLTDKSLFKLPDLGEN